jgi:hypothetical protein
MEREIITFLKNRSYNQIEKVVDTWEKDKYVDWKIQSHRDRANYLLKLKLLIGKAVEVNREVYLIYNIQDEGLGTTFVDFIRDDDLGEYSLRIKNEKIREWIMLNDIDEELAEVKEVLDIRIPY